MPKEMLPIIDKPVIQFVVEEAIASGIKDILIVTGRGKRSIEDHFDRSYELESLLRGKGKITELNAIEKISEMTDVFYVRQKKPLGVANAISLGREYVGDEPFAVLLGDVVFEGREPCTMQLARASAKYGRSVVGLTEVHSSEVGKYGIIKGTPAGRGVYRLEDVVEKPKPGKAPSKLALLGRYVFTPEIFDAIEETPPREGEVLLPDAIKKVARDSGVYALLARGKTCDIGDKASYLKTSIEFGLKRSDTGPEVKAFLRELVKNQFKL
jgi:UTP--glucose-1-phosphate uridylyltransferase